MHLCVRRSYGFEILLVVLVFIFYVIIEDVSCTMSVPCTTGTRTCVSCTCYDSAEHETTTGGQLFFYTFEDYPSGWINYGNNSTTTWQITLRMLVSDLRKETYDGTINNWFISPPIDTLDLQELRLVFDYFFDENEPDEVDIYILEENNNTKEAFYGYNDSDIISANGQHKQQSQGSHSTNHYRSEKLRPPTSELVDILIQYATVVTIERADRFIFNEDLSLDDYVGKQIRLAFRHVGLHVAIDNMAILYQKSFNLSEPTTDDYSGSTACCGGHSEIDVFVPGDTWGGYSKDCNGDNLTAIDFYIYEVDKMNKVVRGQSSVLVGELANECHGSWNNTLTFNSTSNSWIFDIGVPLNNESSICSDRISFGDGLLCLGNERPSLCGKVPRTCDLSFSLRRSVQPQDQYAYLLDENLKLTAMDGTVANRWVSMVAVGGYSFNYFYALDDFGRLHVSGNSFLDVGLEDYRASHFDVRLPKYTTFVLTHMLGKDITGISAGSHFTIMWTREGSTFTHGRRANRQGHGISIPFQTIKTRRLRFIPPVEYVWMDLESTMAKTKSGDMWAFGRVDRYSFCYEASHFGYYPFPIHQLSVLIESLKEKSDSIHDISLGFDRATIVTSSNLVYMCGTNFDGLLGVSKFEALLKPELLEPLPPISTCSSGHMHTICVSTQGNVIGVGNSIFFIESKPKRLDFLAIESIVSVRSIATLNTFITADGRVYIVGINAASTNKTLHNEPQLVPFSVQNSFASAIPGTTSIILVRDIRIGASFQSDFLTLTEADALIEIPLRRSNVLLDGPLTLYITARVTKYLESPKSTLKFEKRFVEMESSNFRLLNETIHWEPGDVDLKNILILFFDDSVYISEKYIEVSINRNGVFSNSVTNILILDDGDAGKLCFGKTNATVREDEGTLLIRVTRKDGSSGTVSALIGELGREAINQADLSSGQGDYIMYPSIITWLDGDDDDKFLSVPIINDDTLENSETFSLRMETFDGSSIEPGCDELNIVIEDDADGGIIDFEVYNITLNEAIIEISRIEGDSGPTELQLSALERPPESFSSLYTYAELGEDFLFDSTIIRFDDRDDTSKFINVTLLQVTQLTIFYLQLTKINGTGQLRDDLDEINLAVSFGKVTDKNENYTSTVSGAVVGVVGASGVIGGMIFYRTRLTQKERLRNQWLIIFSDLENKKKEEDAKESSSFSANYLGIDVFLECLNPRICQLKEETFTQYIVLHHANLVDFIGVVFSPALLVNEYCSKGGIDEALKDGKVPFNTYFKASLCGDAAQGLMFLHSQNISHGLLDLSKLVVNSRFVCKISGLALQPWRLKNPSTDAICWMAPEQLEVVGPALMAMEDPVSVDTDSPMTPLINDENNIALLLEKSTIAGQFADIYSFGIIIFAIFTEDPYPYTEDIHVDISARFKREALRIRIINNNVRPEMPHYLTDVLEGKWKADGDEMKVMELVKHSWERHPKNRPVIKEMCSLFQIMLPSEGDPVKSMHEKYDAHMENLVSSRTQDLRLEQRVSENLLTKIYTLIRNTLPFHISNRLQSGEDSSIAYKYDSVTVFYSEIIDFIKISSENAASEIVPMLNNMFLRFDGLALLLQVERAKTLSDAYVALCGEPISSENCDQRMLLFALAVVEERFELLSGERVYIRVGIDKGPLSEGLVGMQRLSYDVWGPTVMSAKAIASVSSESKVYVSQAVHENLRGNFSFVEVSTANDQYEGATLYIAESLSENEMENMKLQFIDNSVPSKHLYMSNKDKIMAAKNILNVTKIKTPTHSLNCHLSFASGISRQNSRTSFRSQRSTIGAGLRPRFYLNNPSAGASMDIL